jgi:4-amino-4-deoxy-L-arabinose transferase-like glycosyltransferase
VSDPGARPPLTAPRVLAVALLAWLAVAALGLVTGPPLGHDEAAFAVAARGDAPAWLYRSTGVIAIARVGVALGGSELALRLTSVLLGLGVVAGAWAVARAGFGDRVASWVALVVVGVHPLVLHGAELIGDPPATACLLLGAALVVGELDRPGGPRWRVVATAPAFAAAFYLRYGSAPVIALIAALAAAVWGRVLLAAWRQVLATAALLAALLVPYALHSLAATGSVLGVLEVSAAMPRRAYVGEGLVTYLSTNPFRFYGALVAPLLVAGLVALGGLATGVVTGRGPAAPRRRVRAFLGLVALGQLLAIGLQSHAQPRYVFFGALLLTIVGVDAVVRAVDARPAWRLPARRGGLALVTLAWLGVGAAIVPYNRFLADARAPQVSAAAAIRADAAGAPCLVAAGVVTQLMWYARCAGYRLTPADLLTHEVTPPTLRRYAVSLPHATIDVDGLRRARPDLDATALPSADPTTRLWRLTAR